MESNEATSPSSAETQTPTETDQSPTEQNEMKAAATDGAAESGDDGKSASSKKRTQRLKKGTVPPTLSLDEAAKLITSLYENTGGEKSTFDPLSTLTNNSSSSSVFWRKLTTIRNFGLLELDESKLISLTPLGLRIAAPHDPAERLEALKEAFLKVEIFKSAYDKYKGKILPLDEFLINTFTSYVPRELAPEWVEKFKSSAETAGLLEKRNGKMQVRESVLVQTPEIEKEEPPLDNKGGSTEQNETNQRRFEPPPPPADATRTPIPLGPGKLAYIELPSGWQSKDLKKLLRLLTLALGDDSEESEKILGSL